MFRAREPGKIAALMATRNEDWVLGLTLRASLLYCDAVVITDHLSNDRTAGIIEAARREFPHREISVRRSEDPEWMEMDVRHEMLGRARALGATHFVLADADELPTGNLLPGLRARVLGAAPGRFLSLPMISPYHGIQKFRWDGVWGSTSQVPWCFGDSLKLHFHLAGEHQLHRRVPFGALSGGRLLTGHAAGGVFHLQFVDATRLKAKAVWYKMIETLRYPARRTPAQLNEIYDWTLRGDGAELHAIPDAWWEPYRARGWMEFFEPQATPWHLAEVQRLFRQHGAAVFAGLELHGLEQAVERGNA